MMAFRFANGMFEPLWNRNYIDSVQITAAEDLGIGTRAGYYDHAGALRDLIQNHMLQLLCHVAMEPPVSFTAEEVRNEKVKVLHAIHAPTPARDRRDGRARAVRRRARRRRGRAGLPGRGRRAARTRTTETYAALRLEVDNWRWAGVPFYLRTGKRLARKITEIAVTLKPVPHLAFSQDGSLGVQPNQLVLTLQPNEGVSLQLGAKIPGTRMSIRPVNMEFLYGTSFLSQSPEAYERLIIDAMRGDATLFTRNDEVEAQWRICDPIVSAWARDAGAAAQVRSRLAGTAGGRRACCSTATTGARSDGSTQRRRLERAGHDAGRDRSGAARAARRAPRRERQLRAGARAEHDRVRRPRVERGDRQPPARRRAATTPRACSCSPTSHAASAWTRTSAIAAEGEPTPGRARAAARDGDRGARRSPPRRPADDRRPARRHRPADAAVVAARPPRGRRRAARARAGGAARLGRRARSGARRSTAPAPSRTGLRRRPRLAALDAVARADRRHLRPTGAARGADRDRERSRSATTPTRRSRRCC